MNDSPGSGARFHTTRWSVVAAASDATSPAFAELCAAYWAPVYAFLRRRGHDPDAAEEHCQAFFCAVLDQNLVARADAERGRFRSFLLGCLSNFVADARRRAARERRVDVDPAHMEAALEASPEDSPERAFERAWAQVVLERAVERLGAAYAARGDGELYEALRPTLAGGSLAGGYAELAKRTGKTENALRIASHRMRAKLRESIEREVRETLDDPEELASEVGELLAALRA